jgi:hypothetical protein
VARYQTDHSERESFPDLASDAYQVKKMPSDKGHDACQGDKIWRLVLLMGKWLLRAALYMTIIDVTQIFGVLFPEISSVLCHIDEK